MRKLLLLFISFIMFCACSKKDDPIIPNEQELITTVQVNLNPTDASKENVILEFKDLDGDGPNTPTIKTGKLKANTTYNGTLKIKNELTNPITDTTLEIEAEKNIHQLFYIIGNGLNASVTYQDKDDNNKPIGLLFELKTGNVSNGKLKITLIHEPNKSAEGVADGNPSKAGGETDVEVEFDVTIE